MNVYQVVSETLWYTDYIADLGSGPREPYRIAEIVAAPSPGKAKWIAWGTDNYSPSQCVDDMPKFSVRLVRKNEDWPEGVVHGQEHLWTRLSRPWLRPEVEILSDYLWQECAILEDTDEQDFIANGIPS